MNADPSDVSDWEVRLILPSLLEIGLMSTAFTCEDSEWDGYSCRLQYATLTASSVYEQKLIHQMCTLVQEV